MSKQFLRDWELVIIPPWKEVYPDNYKSKEVANKYAVHFTEPLKCTFELNKTCMLDSNSGEITLWNLTPELEASIIYEGAEVALSAGYKDPGKGLIYKGTIIQILRGKESGVNYFLKLICIDSDSYLNLAFASGTIEGGITKREIAKQVLRFSNVQPEEVNWSQFPTSSALDGSQPKLERSKVVFGRTSHYIESLAKLFNSSQFVDGEKLEFFNPEEKPHDIFDLNSYTGLIGTPQQVGKGVRCRCLINPEMKLGGWIKLNNSSILQQEIPVGKLPWSLDLDGLYRIIGITYKGDTRGREWYADLETLSYATSKLVLMGKDQGYFIMG